MSHPHRPHGLPESSKDFPPLADPEQYIRKPKTAPGAANQVTVTPGGKVFATIGDAIASITDASQQKEYLVSVGPGTYPEQIVCKPWVFVQGSGIGVTTIAAKLTDPKKTYAVTAASNSAIQNLSLQVTVGGQVPTYAVGARGAKNFSIENCAINVSDAGLPASMLVALAAEVEGLSSGSVIYVAYSTLTAVGTNVKSQPIGLLCDQGAFVQFTESKVVARGGTENYGAAVVSGCYIMFEDGLIQGDYYAACNFGPNSTVIAKSCQIIGPTQGVIIEP